MAKEFKQNNRKQWASVIHRIFPVAVPSSAEWKSIEDICAVLGGVAKKDLNHMFFPRSGGLDLTAVRPSNEQGCVELMTNTVAHIVQPARLTFDSLLSSPSESYFRLELAPLAPSGIYPDLTFDYEELVELSPNEYCDRAVWDTHSLGEDENGREIRLPKAARLVLRYFAGTFLIVAKGGLYNSFPSTYDGRQNKMSAPEFRRHFQSLVDLNPGWFKEMDAAA